MPFGHMKLLLQSPVAKWKPCHLCVNFSRPAVRFKSFKPNLYTQEPCETEARKKTVDKYYLTVNNSDNSSKLKYHIQDSSQVIKECDLPVIHDPKAGVLVILQKKRDKDSTTTESTISQQELVCNKSLTKKVKYIIKSAGEEIPPYSPYSEDVEVLEDSRTTPEVTLAQSSKINTHEWKPQVVTASQLPGIYASLAKSRLTGLVVLTAVAGYVIAPAPLDPISLLCCTIGIGLVSTSANTTNQFLEVPYDSQMNRTKNRVLVQGKISPLHAMTFGITSGVAGIALLYCGVNTITAGLGVINLLLYTSVYTPMKRMSIYNTWVGAIVGAIPPLIGWAGSTGGLEPGAWIMAGILFAWQFPHFNALSWNLRKDYSRAGYRMMSVLDPHLCRRTALTYSLMMIGICTAAPLLDVTTWTFAADSLPLNVIISYLAWKFYKDADSKSSRRLFGFSLIHLPALLILMIISKKHSSKKSSADKPTLEKIS